MLPRVRAPPAPPARRAFEPRAAVVPRDPCRSHPASWGEVLDAACPASTGERARRVRLVREKGRDVSDGTGGGTRRPGRISAPRGRGGGGGGAGAGAACPQRRRACPGLRPRSQQPACHTCTRVGAPETPWHWRGSRRQPCRLPQNAARPHARQRSGVWSDALRRQSMRGMRRRCLTPAGGVCGRPLWV